MPSLSIVIPAYNEARRLPSTLDQILWFVPRSALPIAEILVVDDGSTDQTVPLAEEYAARVPLVRVLRNPGNRGKGYAVRHGMLAATGDWVLFSDADLSTPIAAANSLYQAAGRAGAAIAFGSRALNRSLVTVRQSWFREMSGRLFNAILRVVTGLHYRDTQCGFKLFRADAARAVFSRTLLDSFSFDVEALVIARQLGFTAVEVPVPWQNAEGSKVTLLRGLESFKDLFVIRLNQLAGKYRA